MKNPADIRHSIKAIGDTRQITSAMRLVSVAKMQKALSRYEANKVYFDRVQVAMKDILLHSREVRHPFMERSISGVPAYVVIAADKGLCGAYNHNLLEFASRVIPQKGEKVVIVIGQEARAYFAGHGVEVDTSFIHINHDATLRSARKLAEYLSERYMGSRINELSIIYTHFKSSMVQIPRVIKVLPLEEKSFQDIQVETDYQNELTYVPSPEVVLSALVPQYINGVVYGAMVQSFASEQCARMLAMENATKNADEMLHKLSVEANRARQYRITSEISEIVATAGILGETEGEERI